MGHERAVNHEVVNQSCRKEKARLGGIENVEIRLLVRLRHGKIVEETGCDERGCFLGPGESAVE